MSNYWLNIYKPKGISSAKLVAIVKYSLGKKIKIGHAGTLDVEAEGVLPLAVGEATKLVQILIDAKKTYVFTLQFGAQTDTGDHAGTVINTTDHMPTREEAFNICSKFIGLITQIPPAFSALKVNGIRSYKLARSGIKAELKPRNITIYNLKCINYDEEKNTATYEAECSKGTYIRTLAEDMALSLQSLAFVIELRRIQVGIFKEANAIKLPEESTTDFFHNLTYKEEFEGNTERRTAAYPLVRKDSSTGLTYKLPLEGGYTRGLIGFLEEKSIRIEAILDDILVLDATEIQAQQIKYGQPCHFDYESDASLLWIRYKGALLAIGSLYKNCFNSIRVFNII